MKILVTETQHFSPEVLDGLREIGELEARDLNRAQLLDAVGDVEVLWIRLRNKIDREVLDAAEALRVIVTPTTGLNHIDVVEAEARGITVLSLKGETEFLRRIRATAEHTLLLMLSVLRHGPDAARHVEDGGWNRDLFRGTELFERTVGLIGYGRLGTIVAHTLHAMGSRVLVCDPFVDADCVEEGVELISRGELLAEADVVSLHVDLNPETEGFFDKECFAAMKPGSVFINTARGELIDETELLARLASGHLAAAAVDVISQEDMLPGAHPVIAYAKEHSNLLVTPHMGGCTFESTARTEAFMLEKLLAFLRA